MLHDGREGGGPLISVTQGDVRAIQLAKSALYAGARLLMDARGVDRVDRVVLAGAFGAHISPLHAMVLGMIPDAPLGAVTSAGNAAGTGARMALVSREARRRVEAMARAIEKVETAVEPRFQEHFVAANALPHATAPFPELAKVVTLPQVSFNARIGARKRGSGGATPARGARTPSLPLTDAGAPIASPSLRGCSSMVEQELPKLKTRVRFPSPAP